MKRKEIKTSGYWVYAHITPDGMFYIGTSQMQPSKRWNPSQYKDKSLHPYIQKYGWGNIRHFIFTDGLTREQALQLEDLLIQECRNGGYCINERRSGLIEVSDVNAYMKQHYATNEEYREKRKQHMKQYYAEHKEEIKAQKKQRRASIEGRIYNRVTAYNINHPDLKIETPAEAKQKYLATGYIPSYIKNNDLI